MRFALLVMTILLTGCGQAPPTKLIAPQHDTTWPWANAVKTEIADGVMQWTKKSADGTKLTLIEFNFAKNPKLQFGIYDQDRNDKKPDDNLTDYFPKGIAGVAADLFPHQRTIAAWNGLFFAYDRSSNAHGGLARHIGPVVIEGTARHNVGRHRWTFGFLKDGNFAVRFKPKWDDLSEFQYAADGAQCLVLDAKPLALAPYPSVPIELGTKLPRTEDTPSSAGHIPITDHIRTSRVSMAWSKGSTKFYVLFVLEPDTENESIRRLRAGEDLGAGWNLFDLQKFWLSKGVWAAVNSDGGVLTQYLIRRPEGDYFVQPSRQSKAPSPMDGLQINEKFNDPGGGSLMSFWVRENPDLAGNLSKSKMNPDDYDDPKLEEEWVESQRTDVSRYLLDQGIKGEVGEWPAWHIAPYVSLWAVESVATPGAVGWWAMSGDLPTDYISSKGVNHPRKAMQVFADNWAEAVKQFRKGEQTPYNLTENEADLLERRAQILVKWVKDDEVWPDDIYGD